jgi:hypothetical protein
VHHRRAGRPDPGLGRTARCDIQTDPHRHLPRRTHPCSFRSSHRQPREGRPWCARRHPPCESAITSHVPIRGSRTDRADGNTPRPYLLQGVMSHTGAAGLPRPPEVVPVPTNKVRGRQLADVAHRRVGDHDALHEWAQGPEPFTPPYRPPGRRHPSTRPARGSDRHSVRLLHVETTSTASSAQAGQHGRCCPVWLPMGRPSASSLVGR